MLAEGLGGLAGESGRGEGVPGGVGGAQNTLLGQASWAEESSKELIYHVNSER